MNLYDTDQGRFAVLPDPFFDVLLDKHREYCPHLLAFLRTIIRKGDIVARSFTDASRSWR